jgi:hypothetical protein
MNAAPASEAARGPDLLEPRPGDALIVVGVQPARGLEDHSGRQQARP